MHGLAAEEHDRLAKEDRFDTVDGLFEYPDSKYSDMTDASCDLLASTLVIFSGFVGCNVEVAFVASVGIF